MRRLFSRLRRRFHMMIRKEATPVPAGGDARPAETNEKPGESDTKPAQSDTKPAQSDARPGETDEKPGESDARPAGPVVIPPEPAAAPPEPAAAPFMSACAAVQRAMKALCPPVLKLGDAERQRLGGQIFYGAVRFVFQMSEILRERPALSPDPARIHAAGLLGRQGRAICWSMVHGVLSELAEQANDCYLHEQGSAVEEAQQVLEAFDLELEQAALRGRPDPKLIEDAQRIARVRVVLRRGEERQRQARRRAEKKLKEARAKVGIREAGAGRKGAGKRRRRGEAAGPPLSLRRWGEIRGGR